MKSESNTANKNLDDRFTFRCTRQTKKRLEEKCKKDNISCSKYISNCIEESLAEKKISNAELAEALCTLQNIINHEILNDASRSEANERMVKIWHALT